MSRLLGLVVILTVSSVKCDLNTVQELLHGQPTYPKCLSKQDIGNITHSIEDKLHCNTSTCGCSPENQIYRLTGSDQNTGICESDFPKFMLILLHYVHEINSTCNNALDYENYVSMATSWFKNETAEHVVEEILENIMKNIEEEEEEHSEEHVEGESDDEEDHDQEEHDEEYNEEHNEEHDDHEVRPGSHSAEAEHQEGHEENSEEHGEGQDHEEDNHEDEHGDHEEGNHEDEHGDHKEENHEDEHGDHEEENHEDEHGEVHDDEDEHHDEDKMVKCFTVDQILDSAGIDHEATNNVTREQVETMATEIVIYLLRGFRYSPKCTALPKKSDFSKALFTHLGVAEKQNMDKKDFSNLLTMLKIGGSNSPHPEEEDDEGHAHAHARRKRATDQLAISSCYDAESLLAIYDVQDEIPADKFSEICPSLIQQQVTDACSAKSTNPPDRIHTVTDAEKYGFGLLAVILVSLCSLIGLLMIPCTGKSAKNDILALFIGLAVGSLSADAFLHLIPAALGVHSDEAGEHAHGSEIQLEPHVQTGLAILAAIYAFFALESIMDTITADKNNVGPSTHGHSHAMEASIGSDSKQDLTTANGSPAGSQHIKTKHGPCGIRSVAWMIIIGDGIHNFADGLAIGAAFSVSLKDGLATSIAVLFHELPHEFGDFAVLVSSGMSYKMAALVNLLSALTAVIGMFIGAALSTSPEISKWIFTVVSGMFIYIALADMIPEMIRMQQSAMTVAVWVKRYFLETIGFLIGVLALTIIALFEEQIRFA